MMSIAGILKPKHGSIRFEGQDIIGLSPAQIVQRGPRLGLHTTVDRLVLTHGAMEALQLALRVATKPGDAVAIEAPSYFTIYPLLRSLGLRAIELPTHPRDGLDLDALEALLEAGGIAAIMAMPKVIDDTSRKPVFRAISGSSNSSAPVGPPA